MTNPPLSTVLITGCSSGIGLAIAQGLRTKKYRVFASCRNNADCERLEKLGLNSPQIDLDDSASILTGLNTVLDQTDGRLDALVNNGAYGQPGAVEDLRRDILRKQFETNVFGTQELTNLVIPVMREANRGRIIQISSVLGFVCLKYRGAYNASKYALEALSDTMRLELAGSGIDISIIEPGPIESKFRENAWKMFQENIDYEASKHREGYTAVTQRLQSDEPAKYTLPADAVFKATLHALQSNNPKLRYRITIPTRVFSVLKRLLTDRTMDRILSKS